MARGILLLPTELLLEILGYLDKQDVYSFASASKACYDNSVHILFRKIDLPSALRSGALERHEKYQICQTVRRVDLSIEGSDSDFWFETENAQKLVEEWLLRFQNICELKICLAEAAYKSTSPTARFLKLVFRDLLPKLSCLDLEIYAFKTNDKDLERLIESVRVSLLDEPSCAPYLTALRIWITAFRPRNILKCVIPMLSKYAANLHLLDIRVRWNLEILDRELDGEMDDEFLYLKGLKSEKMRCVAIEDKSQRHAEKVCKQIRKRWPNVEDLEVDLGVMKSSADYTELSPLRSLKKLNIMFPYLIWSPFEGNNMAEEAEFPARYLGIWLDFPSLEEIGIKYLGGDCSMAQTAVFKAVTGKSYLSELEDREGEESGDDQAAKQLVRRDLQLDSLWVEKGDYMDILGLRSLLRGTVVSQWVKERIENYILVDELREKADELLGGLDFGSSDDGP
ncbi:hypothetical protein ABW19_dt0203697 [Dactylella cylindrospora]|nr:hypothetical protein ABW19_dt0203697 [Dactylella cylindrospora]